MAVQRAQLEKYREKVVLPSLCLIANGWYPQFDKLKTHAKEKREAKLKLANGATKA